jgi:hypothetical protein
MFFHDLFHLQEGLPIRESMQLSLQGWVINPICQGFSND